MFCKMKTPGEIHQLKDEFERAVSFIPEGKQKYYHVNSIRNFIDSISLFMDAGIQDQVFTHLQDYVHFIRNNTVLNTGESLTTYNKFLRPVAKYYEMGLDFTIHIKPSIFIIALLFTIGILYLFSTSILLITAMVFIMQGLYLRNYRKSKQKKSYAFMW
jgi:hypothetical protein